MRPNIFPILRYEDAMAAIDWLERAFGFERHVVYEGEDGKVQHAVLRLGTGMIMVGSEREDSVNGGIYIALDEIDGHCDRARASGAEIVHKPFDTDYGSRDYIARDLEGNVWSFGTYLPE